MDGVIVLFSHLPLQLSLCWFLHAVVNSTSSVFHVANMHISHDEAKTSVFRSD
jgi:hypothetical protein